MASMGAVFAADDPGVGRVLDGTLDVCEDERFLGNTTVVFFARFFALVLLDRVVDDLRLIESVLGGFFGFAGVGATTGSGAVSFDALGV